MSCAAMQELLWSAQIYLEAAGGYLEGLLNEKWLAVAFLDLPVALPEEFSSWVLNQ